jgi:predicted metallopeptidase
MAKRRNASRIAWKKAPDIKKMISEIVKKLGMVWIDVGQIHCYRSEYSSSRAYARIWGLSKVWQLALKEKPTYIIEVLSEKYDDLPQKEKYNVLIHELAHVPKNFSGSLLPHIRRRGKRNFHDRVTSLINSYKSSR